MPTMIDAILFDMDGLMIDSESISANAWLLAGEQHGIKLDDELLMGLVGLSVNLSRDYVARHFNDAELASQLSSACRVYYRQLLHEGDIPLKPGIVELLQWVNHTEIPHAVATSTQRTLADLKLARTGLAPYFDITVAGDEVVNPKPAPDVYLAAAAKLGVKPERCMVLEDSPYGLQAAMAANMQTILVPDLIQPTANEQENAYAVCTDLHEALVLLKRL